MERSDISLQKITHHIRNAKIISRDDIHYIRAHTNNDQKMELIIIYNNLLEWMQNILDLDGDAKY